MGLAVEDQVTKIFRSGIGGKGLFFVLTRYRWRQAPGGSVAMLPLVPQSGFNSGFFGVIGTGQALARKELY